MIVTVRVTQADLDAGQPGEPCMCPVALAIQRAVPGWSPWIAETEIEPSPADAIFGLPAYDCIELPATVVAFIENYDTDVPGPGDFGPFEFTIDVPDRLIVALHIAAVTR